MFFKESKMFDIKKRKQFGKVVSKFSDTGKTGCFYFNFFLWGGGVLNDSTISLMYHKTKK